MVTNFNLDDTSRVRRTASRLLHQLQTDRASLEARLAELGRVDPIKCVTGVSSLEKAISDIRRLMSDMDRLLEECRPLVNGANTAH
jgi:hypothetical protein